MHIKITLSVNIKMEGFSCSQTQIKYAKLICNYFSFLSEFNLLIFIRLAASQSSIYLKY